MKFSPRSLCVFAVSLCITIAAASVRANGSEVLLTLLHTNDCHGRVSLPGTPYLAGSALTMNTAVQNSVRFAGVTLEEAAAMASSNPAKFVDLETVGTITADWDAERLELRVITSTDSRLS